MTSQQQPTVVVTSHLPVVSVGSLTPNQLAQTLVKQAGGSKTVTQAVATGTTGINPSRLTPQQINILKQQALMKKNANNKQLQGINPTSVSGGSAAGTTVSGQKVSIAVTPSGVTLATLANSMPVTVVTQALGQQKTQLIRGVSGTKGNSLRMTEADMKLLLASKQQLQAQQKGGGGVTTSQQQSITQLLQGVSSGQVITTGYKKKTKFFRQMTTG